jgi:hypothetical protein
MISWGNYDIADAKVPDVDWRADQFHRRELQNPKAKEECTGIKVNIWNRVKVGR